MQLTLCGRTALRALRAIRCGLSGGAGSLRQRCQLIGPDPSSGKRWTKTLLRNLTLGQFPLFVDGEPIEVAVSDQGHRLGAADARCSVFPQEGNLFVPVGGGLAISSPELLFVEMARHLDLPSAVLLGMELCGGYALRPNANDPEPATTLIPPVTSVERIESFIDSVGPMHGTRAARAAIEFVVDNAWSPMEAVMAAMLSLPTQSHGYGLGPLILNERVTLQEGDAAMLGHSRVPDILLTGWSVGINYDGGDHLDLGAIAKAAELVALNPGEPWAELALARAKTAVRGKVIDDQRRNRELEARGLTVVTATKEDVFVPGALDDLMQQVIGIAQQRGFTSADFALEELAHGAEERQELLNELLWESHCTP